MTSNLRAQRLTGAELQAAASRCNLTAAVFGKPGTVSVVDIALVYIDKDTGSAEAEVASRGYTFCGTISVIAGEPHVEPESGAFASAALVYAGPLFAQKLGENLKELQQQEQRRR